MAANPRTLQPAAVIAMPGSKSTASNRVVADGASRACGVERCGSREGCKVIGVVPWWRAVCTGGWLISTFPPPSLRVCGGSMYAPISNWMSGSEVLSLTRRIRRGTLAFSPARCRVPSAMAMAPAPLRNVRRTGADEGCPGFPEDRSGCAGIADS